MTTSDGPHKVNVDQWREILSLQVTQCWDDIRQMDSLLWQIPAGIGAIAGLLASALSTDVLSGRPTAFEIGLVGATCLITYSLVVAAYKNRVFQVARNVHLKSCYAELLRVAALQHDTLVEVHPLTMADLPLSSLPGLLPFSTREVDSTTKELAAVAGLGAPLNRFLVKRGAFRILWWISVGVMLGEATLFGTLLVHALSA